MDLAVSVCTGDVKDNSNGGRREEELLGMPPFGGISSLGGPVYSWPILYSV